jgi:hypothetical protein
VRPRALPNLTPEQLELQDQLIALAEAFELSPEPNGTENRLSAAQPLTTALEPPANLTITNAGLRIAGRRFTQPARARSGARMLDLGGILGQVSEAVRDQFADLLPDDVGDLLGPGGLLETDELAELLEPDLLEELRDELTAVVEGVGRATALPEIAVKATWEVLDVSGQAPALAGADFLPIPGPPDVLGLDLLFAPDSTEQLGQGQQGALGRKPLRVRASVELSARLGDTEISSGRRTVSDDIRVGVLDLPVPKLFCMFRHHRFRPTVDDPEGNPVDGFVLVMVSDNGPFERDPADEQPLAEPVAGPLEALKELVQPLKPLGRFGAFITALELLTELLRDQIEFGVDVSPLKNLNRIRMINQFGIRHDTEADNQVSSVVLLGPKDARVRCFVAKRLGSQRGELDIRLGPELVALVPTLPPLPQIDFEAVGLTPGLPEKSTITVVQPCKDNEGNFADAISSVRFA